MKLGMYHLELRDFILSHDNWEKLLSEPPYSLKIHRDNGLILFRYNQLSADFNLEIVREARGIIFKEDTWECVCHAFNKFGNYLESYVPDINWDNCRASEKIDGSLIKLYWCYGKWNIATNGIINARDSELDSLRYQTYEDLFLAALENLGYSLETLGTLHLNSKYTYMFELVSPYNQVVIPYDDFGIYYLGQRDMETGREVYDPIKFFGSGIYPPKNIKSFELKEFLQYVKGLPWTQEGFVVCDENFNRCKIKSDAYIRAAYLRNNNHVTTKRLIDIILANEVDEFLTYCQDYKQEVDDVRGCMICIETYANNQVEVYKTKFGNLSRREYVENISRDVKQPFFKNFFFKNYNYTLSWKEYTSNWSLNKWCQVVEDNMERYKRFKEVCTL